MDESSLLLAFVAHLEANGNPGLAVDRWPDKTNTDTADIDAIAGMFAIEHTSIDTLPGQRMLNDWFVKAVAGLETELKGSVPFHLWISVAFDAVGKGQNWGAIRSALKGWVESTAYSLNDGVHRSVSVPGIPFPLWVRKGGPLDAGLFFARFEIDDDTLPPRIKALLDRKSAKLSAYRDQGKKTIILLENDDIGMMNDEKLLTAVRVAYAGALPPAIDQLWYADTCIEQELRFIEFSRELLAR